MSTAVGRLVAAAEANLSEIMMFSEGFSTAKVPPACKSAESYELLHTHPYMLLFWQAFPSLGCLLRVADLGCMHM